MHTLLHSIQLLMAATYIAEVRNMECKIGVWFKRRSLTNIGIWDSILLSIWDSILLAYLINKLIDKKNKIALKF